MIGLRPALLGSFAMALVGFAQATDEKPAAPASTAEIKTLSCDAPFDAKATEETLKQAFGAENVVYKIVPGAEGTDANATVIFPNDPARMVTVFWWDEDKRQRPSTVQVQAAWSENPDDANPWKTDILWQTPQGLRIGSTVEEVEQANGKPFKISGFEWDYGGYAVNWEGGKLDWPEGGCGLSVRFSPEGQVPAAASGEVELKSTDAPVRAAKPRVTDISIGYPEGEPAKTP